MSPNFAFTIPIRIVWERSRLKSRLSDICCLVIVEVSSVLCASLPALNLQLNASLVIPESYDLHNSLGKVHVYDFLLHC